MNSHPNPGETGQQPTATSQPSSQNSDSHAGAVKGPLGSRFRILVLRSLRLRCPQCGQGKLFRSLFRMHDKCPVCQFQFEREPGFFLGSIYFNYGLTALVTAVLYPILHFAYGLPNQPVMTVCVMFAVLFPIWFFRYARALWLGFDQWIDPR